jgi:hypothetical protein
VPDEQLTFAGISVRLPESSLIYLLLDRVVVDTNAI